MQSIERGDMENKNSKSIVDEVLDNEKNSKTKKKSLLSKLATKPKVTIDDVKKLFPEKKHVVTEEIADMLNEFIHNDNHDGYGLITALRDNRHFMVNMGYSLKEYINAVRFVGFLLAGDNVADAYIKTFYFRDFVKEQVKKCKEEGINDNTGSISWNSKPCRILRNAAIRFKSSKLVKELLQANILPEYIAYMGFRKEAIAVLYDRMYNSKLDRDRINAADKLLQHTAPPKEAEVTIDVQGGEDKDRINLLESIRELVKQQKQQILNGADIKEVQQLGLNKAADDVIDAEVSNG